MASRGGVPPDHYAVLELPMTASEQDVRKAYRRLAVRWHPDKNPHDAHLAEVRFKQVSEAYEVLRDPNKRRQYDHVRAAAQAGANGRPSMGHSWFDGTGSAADFGDDLWQDDGLMSRGGGRGAGWAFRNPFDIFKEFFGDTDPWADLSRPPRDGRTNNDRRGTRRNSPWPSSADNDPFFSSAFPSPFFASPFFGHRGRDASLFDQHQPSPFGRTPLRAESSGTNRRVTEIKIHGFSDDENNAHAEDEDDGISNRNETRGHEREEIVIEDGDEDGANQGEDEDDPELKEALRLSLLQEHERKMASEQENDPDLEEAIRRSLEEQSYNAASGPDDRMEIYTEAHLNKHPPALRRTW